MPPPRAKLYNKTGKVKTLKNQTHNNPSTSSSEIPSSSQQDPGLAEQQFIVELLWCIQQIENSLNSEKLNQKQAQDAVKTLNILKSANQPIIKKRQIMRSYFGDYRSKMADEEKKMSLASRQIKFTQSGLNSQVKKPYFVKKSSLLTSGKDFKFNFPVEELDQLCISTSNHKNQENNKINEQSQEELIKSDDNKDTNTEEKPKKEIKNIKFIPTGNSFKFNFNINEEIS